MERNSGIFEHFMAVIDDVSPRLRWAAGTRDRTHRVA